MAYKVTHIKTKGDDSFEFYDKGAIRGIKPSFTEESGTDSNGYYIGQNKLYNSKEEADEVAKLNDTEQKDVEEYNCTMKHEIACKIENKAVKIGMTKEQAKMSVSISAWETGRWTSSAYHSKNNVGGMMCNSGLINYSSLDEGIEAFLINLKKNYFDIGLDTFDKIQKKYCPIGAKNDPTGLNKNWLNGVNKMYEEFGG